MFKKSFLLAVIMVLGMGAFAKAACSPQDFQKEVMAMQTTMTEMSKDPEKFAKINEEFEKMFSPELMEFAKMAQGAAGDPTKTQEMLDKGCDLYGRMNKMLNENK